MLFISWSLWNRKTSFITALAHEYKRDILEIPFSRIKTNEELDHLINIEKINETIIDKKKLIIVFDEIDRNNDVIIGKDVEDDSGDDSNSNSNSNIDVNTNIIIDALQQTSGKKIKTKIKSNEDDKLNMSFILSKFDGLGNYNGLIIIATTNNVDKIHPALLRDMRMTKIYFSYMKKKHIVNMIEKYYEIKLNNDIIEMLPDEENCLTGATCKLLIKNNHDNIDKLLEKLHMVKLKQ